jgi:hypothetical protein
LKDDVIFDFAQAPQPGSEGDAAEEKAEISNFVFDSDAMIDIDALEAFVQQKRDILIASEEPLHIDIGSMVVSKKEARKPNAIKQHMEVEEQQDLKQANQQHNHGSGGAMGQTSQPKRSQFDDENFVAMT